MDKYTANMDAIMYGEIPEDVKIGSMQEMYDRWGLHMTH